MTSALDGIRVVLLDIEGTTTPIAFVHERLFGYVRSHLDSFLAANWSRADVQEAVQALAAEHLRDRDMTGVPGWRGDSEEHGRHSVSAYARWLMEFDRKSPGLKSLQGLIWQAAYESGELRGEVFSDVAPAMAAWRQRGLRIAIYSSGSALAQRLLFASTPAGDLTRLIEAYFDTAVGGKKKADSYRAIAASLQCPPNEILFLSDVSAELTAAQAAGCAVMLSVRPGNPDQPDANRFPQVSSFDRIA